MIKKIYLLSPTKKEDTIHTPTIEIKFLDREILERDFNTLIFSSKNGVKALNRVLENWQKFPAIAVGKGTEKEILRLNGTVLDSPESSYGENIAELILKKHSNREFLYIRPEKIVSKMPEILKDNSIKFSEATLYKTLCREVEKIDDNSIVIVSSPSTINCLLKYQRPPNSTIFVAIGKKSYRAVPKEFKSYIAPHQTLQSSIEFAKSLVINS